MNRKLFLGSLALLGVLAGCTDQRPASSQDQASVMRMQMQMDDMKCRSYGAQVGSQAYVQCRVQLDNARQQQTALRRAQPPSLFGGLLGTGYGSTY